MSTLAVITVKNCDHCGHVAVLRNESEWETFTQLWYEGFNVDFCPACKREPAVVQRVGADIKLRNDIAAKVKELAERPKEETEHAH